MGRTLSKSKEVCDWMGWSTTNASDSELGAILSQVVEGEEHPVLYISRKLSIENHIFILNTEDLSGKVTRILQRHHHLLFQRA
ncbi:hypothetical protein PGIGA_G00066420 [Pangasianodon gigas]|uniref:Uncharacterized protein n=1 Tax=Pangasianodon gigas TaxID=30993 RepID=A0ACC5X604_PANGG|nr:hypothetical protein [Pangasianodon gigas]